MKMSFVRKLTLAGLAFGVIAMFFATAMAQQPQPTTQNPPDNQQNRPFERGQGRHGPGGAGGFGMMRELDQLNLTDAQKQQIQTILKNSAESTKSQREQLGQLMQKRSQGTLSAADESQAQTLRQQVMAARKDAESKVLAVLTPDQKTKLEELRKQRQADHGGFNRRGGFPNRTNPPSQPPANPSQP
jgi:Spy/CpxP family protein refolding chaperone